MADVSVKLLKLVDFARKFTALALMNAGRPSAHLTSIFALSRA